MRASLCLILTNVCAVVMFTCLTAVTSNAQLPISWQASLGGDRWDALYALRELPNEGYVLAGMTQSNVGFDVDTPPVSVDQWGNPMADVWVLKMDNFGKKVWSSRLGGDGNEYITDIWVCANGDFIFVASTTSQPSGQKASPSYGNEDFWVGRLNTHGDLLWETTLGGSGTDFGHAIREYKDGTIYVAGHSDSPPSGNKTAQTNGMNDFWLVKLTADGQMIWDKTYGGAGDERAYGGFEILEDGNLMFAGGSSSPRDTRKDGVHYGEMDFWAVKLDPNGKRLWDVSFGGEKEDQVRYIAELNNGDILLTGGTRSGITGNKTSPHNKTANTPPNEDLDYWIVRITASGDKVWEHEYGGERLDALYGVSENYVGNILLGGVSRSPISGNKTVASNGKDDMWILFLDPSGEVIWQDSYGGDENDSVAQLYQVSDGGYIVAGQSDSHKSGNKVVDTHGFNDCWIIKLDCQWTFDAPQTFEYCEDELVQVDLDMANCPPCKIAWPDGEISDSRTFDDLPAGEHFYDTKVVNPDGCTDIEWMEVIVYGSPTVQLPQDTFVEFAKELLLMPQVTDSVLQYEWSTGSTQSVIQVDLDDTYSVTVTSDAGCTGHDEVTVEFGTGVYFYMPNAFSPNGDGYNDYFHIFADDKVALVNKFFVLDRWGDLVYLAENFHPDDWSVSWDGTYRGEALNNGTYLYRIQVTLTNNKVVDQAGTISILK